MDLFQIPFEPVSLLKNPIAQTMLGSQFTGDTSLPARVFHKVPLEAENALVCLEIPPIKNEVPVVVMAHGMGGCSESGYMRRIARKFHRLGIGVFMLNHRGSGPGIGLSDRLWNGGSSADLRAVVNFVARLYPSRPILLTGFSLSGNILLKYLGEAGNIPSNVFAALAVNPPIDLKVASKRISEGPWARTFNKYYMDLIQRQARGLEECFPDAFIPPREANTIYKFDVAYTAPVSRHRDVDHYYENSSANRFLDKITVPTTILCSQDDPFVPPEVFQNIPKSLCVHLVAPEYGGHMGYLSKNILPTGDHRWMDYAVLEWANKSSGGFGSMDYIPIGQEKA